MKNIISKWESLNQPNLKTYVDENQWCFFGSFNLLLGGWTVPLQIENHEHQRPMSKMTKTYEWNKTTEKHSAQEFQIFFQFIIQISCQSGDIFLPLLHCGIHNDSYNQI